jgi:tetratricopeptide (TPR) repeat protein
MLKGITRSGLALTLALVFSMAGLATAARAQQGQQQKPTYTLAEYNAYQAAAKETNPQQRIKLLDDFVAKFPKSTLLPYVYQSYYQTYDQLKQYDKVIEYADKLAESTAKEVDSGMKLRAIYQREVAFNMVFSDKTPDAAQQAQKARDYAQRGLKLLGELKPPKGMTDEQFKQQLKGPYALFSYTEGFTALFLKDYPAAVTALRQALENDPKNPVTYFRLGLAYLQIAAQKQAAGGTSAPAQTPAAAPATGAAAAGATPAAAQGAPLPGPSAGQEEYMKGFWALARSVALKGATEQTVRAYLQNQMLVYQKTACQDLLTAEMNQLLQMAQTTETIDPPAGYSLPSGVQLGQYLQNSNLFTIMQDLQTGGDRATFVWLAVCGNEFPQVPIKVISVTPTADGVDMQVYTGQTPKDLQAAKTANMEVKVVNQTDAQRLEKDNIVRFTGTLASYDPAPNFLLHWDKAQVNPADIPPAKPGRKRGGARHHQR